MTGRPDVAVVGGGVIGLAVAWRAAQRGLSVAVIDPNPGSGASAVAAGMLAPVTELHYAERALLDLTLASAAAYPAFVAELEAETGLDVGYRQCGTVSVGWMGSDLAALRDLADFQRGLGLTVDVVSAADLRRLEPLLAPGLPGGVLVSGDHQVDPPRLLTALRAAATAAGVEFVAQPLVGLSGDDDTVTGVRLAAGSTVPAGQTVLASGAWSALVDLPGGVSLPVRPVKGQTLHLAGEPGLLAHVVRGEVRGAPVYLVPRDDGRLVVGASSEEVGFDLRARAGVVHDLLRDAQALVPAVAELELVEVRTGLRPGTPDNAPLLGTVGVGGLVVATGHHRNGVLLAPVTADGIADLLAHGTTPTTWSSFEPLRFAGARTESRAAAWN
jgi:glycine oxidase